MPNVRSIHAGRSLAYVLVAALIAAALSLPSCTGGGTPYKETRTVMGTYVTITAARDGLPEEAVRAAVGKAFGEIERVDALMSTYKPESELSRVNKHAGMGPVKVDPEVADTVGMALDIARETGGAFDPTVGPLVKLWGIASKGGRVPSPGDIEATLGLVDYTQVVVDWQASTVFIKKPGMSMDLGGIAKGYASDRAAESLVKSGIPGGIVAVAGDLKLFGTHEDGTGWAVGIQHPRDKSKVMARFELSDRAISTSGDYERYFIKDGIRYHHIIDPRTGYPARGFMSVSVLSQASYMADSLATGLFVMVPDKAFAFAKAHPELDVMMVKSDGEKMATGMFRDMETAPVEPD